MTKTPPAPDPLLEAACSSTLRATLDAYVAFERRVQKDDEKYLFRAISHVVTFAGEEALQGYRLGRDAASPAVPAAAGAAPVGHGAGETPPDLRARLAFARGGHKSAGVSRSVGDCGSTTAAPVPGASSAVALKRLPLVRGALCAIALGALLALGGAACGAPAKRLELAKAPAAARPGTSEYRDPDMQVTFDARTDAIRVTIANLSKEPLTVAWDRAFYVDPAGKKHPVIGYKEPRTAVLRQDPPAPLVIAPGATWSGRVHRRDRIRPPSGPRFYEAALLTDEEEKPGALVGLDLPVDVGRRPLYHEFRFRVTDKEVTR